VNKLHGAPAFASRAGRAVSGLRWPRPSPVRGPRVTATSRDGTRAEQAAEKLGNGALGVELDLRDESSVDACVERTFDRLGGIGMLVNNAGIGMRTINPRFMSEPQRP
jgi:NAD(P)-dependent dehydrogenase (short-subunit alcohol dehydrogenase family)